MDWDKEITCTLTVKDLYYLQHCVDSVLCMNQVYDFMTGYEELSDVQQEGMTAALVKTMKILKENR